MKRTGNILLILLLTFSLALLLGFDYPSDIQGHWAEENIKNFVDEGISKGYADGTFKPNHTISVAEFLTFTLRANGIAYEDIGSGDWYSGVVDEALKRGIISEGEFADFNKNISREEIARIIIKVISEPPSKNPPLFHDNGEISEINMGYVRKAVDLGIISGYTDGTFNPKGTATRAEAVKVLTASLNITEKDRERAKQLDDMINIDPVNEQKITSEEVRVSTEDFIEPVIDVK